jgi:oligopeptide transport system substrate-binding protein
MTELNINSLNSVKILVAENMINSDYMHYFTQKWQQLFGVYIGFEIVHQSEYEQKLRDGEYKVAIYEITGDYNSVFSVLSKFSSDKNDFGYSSAETDNLLSRVGTISSLSDCVDIFRNIEKQIISDSSFIPVFYKKKYLIYRKTNADIIYNPFSGYIDFQYAKYFED